MLAENQTVFVADRTVSNQGIFTCSRKLVDWSLVKMRLFWSQSEMFDILCMQVHNKIQKHTSSPCCTSFSLSTGSFGGARVSQWKVTRCRLLRTLFEDEEVETQIMAQIIVFFLLTSQLSYIARRFPSNFYQMNSLQETRINSTVKRRK